METAPSNEPFPTLRNDIFDNNNSSRMCHNSPGNPVSPVTTDPGGRGASPNEPPGSPRGGTRTDKSQHAPTHGNVTSCPYSRGSGPGTRDGIDADGKTPESIPRDQRGSEPGTSDPAGSSRSGQSHFRPWLAGTADLGGSSASSKSAHHLRQSSHPYIKITKSPWIISKKNYLPTLIFFSKKYLPTLMPLHQDHQIPMKEFQSYNKLSFRDWCKEKNVPSIQQIFKNFFNDLFSQNNFL